MTPLRPRLLPAFAVLFLTAPAFAQDIPPKIWDVPFGTPIDSLGVDFAEPACGTNGGPPSTQLASFADFAQCPTEPDGLREIWFRYDDTIEYLARAVRNPVQAIRFNFTKVGMQPAILSSSSMTPDASAATASPPIRQPTRASATTIILPRR